MKKYIDLQYLGLHIVMLIAAVSPGRALANSIFIDNLLNGQDQVIVTMGTSLTADSESQPEVGTKWVAQIRNWLAAKFPGQATVLNYGRAGSASSQPAGRSGFAMLPTVLAANPDTVFIEYTTNDSHISYGISLQDSEDNIKSIIDQIYANDPNTEVILQVMNVVKNPSAIQCPDILAYDQVYRDVAQQRGLQLIDHHDNYQDLLDNQPAVYDIYVPDGVHPTAIAHANMEVPYVKDAVWPGATPDPDAIVAYWPIDEGSGTALEDTMDNGYDGSISAGVTWGSDSNRTYLVFNEVQGEVNCGGIDFAGSVTISAWVNYDASGSNTYRRAVAKGNFSSGWQLGLTSANTAEFAATEDLGTLRVLSGTTAMSTSSWNHIVGVYDIDTDAIYLYVNGNLENSTSISPGSMGIMLNADPFMIGRAYPEGGANRWKGFIDGISYWNRALSIEEVTEIYQNNKYDGSNGMTDLAGIASHWLDSSCVDLPACGGADLDGDVDVDLYDFAIFGSNWMSGL